MFRVHALNAFVILHVISISVGIGTAQEEDLVFSDLFDVHGEDQFGTRAGGKRDASVRPRSYG